MVLSALRETFRRYLFLPDPAVVDFVAAVAVANRLGGDPLWGFVVAPPSNGKTEALQALMDLPEAHALSTLSENTLLSGARDVDGRRASLLLRLPQNVLLILKDFTTILSMRDEARAAILAQFREVYDGSLVKETGTGRSIRWQGRLGFLAGVTPAIDAHHAVIATLGERFVYLRVPEAPRKDLARTALRARDEVAMRATLRSAVSEFVGGLDLTRPEIPDDIAERLVNVADVVTWARSAVQRDRFSRDIEVAPSREAPGRFVQQLGVLWQALTVMGHEDPIGFVCRVALDSMPPARSVVLRALAADWAMSTNALRVVSRLSQSTNRRLLEDLEALGLVEIVDRGHPAASGQPAQASTWALTPAGRETWGEGFGTYPPRPAPPLTLDDVMAYAGD